MVEFITSLDFGVLYWIQENLRCAFLDEISAFLSVTFDLGIFWLALALIFVAFRRTRAWGLAMLLSVIITFVVGELGLKNIFCRVRPCNIDFSVPLAVERPEAYSFPSGHTGSSFAAAGALFGFNKRIGITALVLAASIGLSRIYLFVHYPTDVLAGMLLGLSVAFGVVYMFRKYALETRLGRLPAKKRA